MVTYTNGGDAAEEISGSGDIGVAYKVVQGSATLTGSLKKRFHDDQLYALYAYNYDVATLKIVDWRKWIDEEALLDTFSGVPEWPSEGTPDRDTAQYWRDVFQAVGSHIIEKVAYGSRLEVVGYCIPFLAPLISQQSDRKCKQFQF